MSPAADPPAGFSLGLRHPVLRWKRLRRAARLILPYMKKSWRAMSLALACGLGATLMQVLQPWPIKILFDGVLLPAKGARPLPGMEFLPRLPADTIVALACLGLLAVAFAWGLLSYGQAYLTARAGQSAVFALRQKAYAQLQRLSLTFHRQKKRGDLLMRLTGDINVLRDMIVDAGIQGVGAAFMLATMTAVMLAMDWRLAVLVLILLPPLALTTVRFSTRIRHAARRQRQNEGRAAALIHEMLAGISLIQASGGERQSEEAFGRTNRDSQKAGLRTTRLEASQSRAVEIILAAGTSAVLWYGVHRVRSGVLTPGDLLVFVSYVHGALRPLRHLARVSTRLSKAIVCAERVIEVLRTEPEVRDDADARSARRVEGRLEFRDVSFRHHGGPEVLHRIGFTIPAGRFVGIVGPSGAGKSTVLALLLRLYDPQSGQIRLDDRDLRRYRVQSLRERMSVVLQEPLLFGSTVRENIAFGRPGASQDEIERAARLAGCDEFITGLPQGYDTPIAEAGASLSGGQRQRLCIARAFLRDTPVLLLDEPTFGLDPASEAAVMESIGRLAAGRTTVLVSHRLAAVRAADVIIVLRRGRIDARGSFEELLRGGGWFARAWERQVAGGPAAAAADGKERPAGPLGQSVLEQGV